MKTAKSLQRLVALGVPALIALIYAASWIALASPYRPMPSDDRRALAVLDGARDTKDAILHLATDVAMRVLSRAWAPLVPEIPARLVAITVCFNVMTALVLFCWGRRVTQRLWPGALAMLIFLLCAWPSLYIVVWFYAPIAAFYTVVAAFLIFASIPPSRWGLLRLALAGVALAAGALSCVSAAVVVALLGLLAFGCYAPAVARGLGGAVAQRPGRALAIGLLGAGAVMGLVVVGDWHTGAMRFIAAYREHLGDNVTGIHYNDAVKKFGRAPRVPAISGLWILSRYSLALTAGYLAASALAVYLCAVRYASRKRGVAATAGAGPSPGQHVSAPLGMVERGIVLLAALAWGHELIVDILPTTKLARTHFLTFPLICMLLALSAFWSVARAPGRWPLLWRGALVAWLAVAGIEGLTRNAATLNARHALPRYLRHTFPDLKLVVVAGQDPHWTRLVGWLAGRDPGSDSAMTARARNSAWDVLAVDLTSFNPHDPRYPKPLVLVLGPTGVDSGNSVLQHGCLTDFMLPVSDYAANMQAQLARFPYVAYSPLVCLEEENCQGLLAEGRIPVARRDLRKSVSVLWWPTATP